MTHRCASANQLTFATEPLAFRYKRNPVTVLVHCKITAVTEDDGVGVLAVPIVTDRTFTVLLFAATAGRLSIDRSC